MTTKDDNPPLNPKQQKVLLALLAGHGVAEAAKLAGVARQTVSEWIHRPGPFRKAYQREQDRQLAEARGLLRSAAVDAARHLRSVINNRRAEKPERLRAAVAVLKLMPLREDIELSEDLFD